MTTILPNKLQPPGNQCKTRNFSETCMLPKLKYHCDLEL